MATITVQPEIKILYIKSPRGIETAKESFSLLESKLPTIKGRKFYALVIGSQAMEYRACVAQISQDDPAKMGVNIGVIPGGSYVQEKLTNWNENIPKFREIFHKLKTEYSYDETRPCVEYYRSLTEVLLRVPIKEN